MFLKAGALSLALLLASRILGLARESAQAAAFGASGLGDIAVLMFSLPDWVAGVLVSGALAYVLVPAWAAQGHSQVAATQRRAAWLLLGAGAVLALLLVLWRQPASRWLAAGVSGAMQPAAASAIAWSALALPAAMLAALWATRLQHERDFAGMYAANLVVNAALIAIIAASALLAAADAQVRWLGLGLLTAMVLRLLWLHWRTPRLVKDPSDAAAPAGVLPPAPVWLWAALAAGLPLALPFAARSIASQSGEGALATFNYAWKLVELPLLLAIQLVATLALPAIARALAAHDQHGARLAARAAFALAWALACAAAAALLLGAPAIAGLLFGWGRMEPQALARVAQWGATGAWGLLPQAVTAVALSILAARGAMRAAVGAYALALVLLLSYAARGGADGGQLMIVLNFLQAGVAVIVLAAIGSQARAWLPWRAMVISTLCLLVLAGLAAQLPAPHGLWVGLIVAGLAGMLVLAATWWGSPDLRAALAR